MRCSSVYFGTSAGFSSCAAGSGRLSSFLLPPIIFLGSFSFVATLALSLAGGAGLSPGFFTSFFEVIGVVEPAFGSGLAP